MIPLALFGALRLAQRTVQTPQTSPGQAPPPQKALQTPVPGSQAPTNPTGELGPRPQVPPPRVVDPKAPPPVVLPSEPSPDVPQGPLTAQEAARIALRLQPSILAARGGVQVAQGNAQVAASALNPQANLNADYTNARVLSGPGGGGGGLPITSSVGVSQLLFDFGQTRNLVRRDRALTDAALADLDRASLNAVDDVENAFYAVANDHRLVLVAEADVANRQRQLELARARFTTGIGLPVDVATAETSKGAAIQALIAARDTENQDRVRLLQLIGLNPLTPLDASEQDEPSIDVADPRGLLAVGVQRRPEVRSALATLSAGRYGLSAAKAANLPTIVGTVGGALGGTSLAGTYGSSTSFGIGLSFPFFDGGRRNGLVTAARGQITTAEANLRTAVLQVQSDVASAAFGLRAAEQRAVVAEAQVRNAEEALRIAEGRYANGLGLFQDITTAQEQLNAALQDASNARNALNLARVKVRYATAQLVTGGGGA